jgi:hypothetical protein
MLSPIAIAEIYNTSVLTPCENSSAFYLNVENERVVVTTVMLIFATKPEVSEIVIYALRCTVTAKSTHRIELSTA